MEIWVIGKGVVNSDLQLFWKYKTNETILL